MQIKFLLQLKQCVSNINRDRRSSRVIPDTKASFKNSSFVFSHRNTFWDYGLFMWVWVVLKGCKLEVTSTVKMLHHFDRNTRIISIRFLFRFCSCVCMCVHIPSAYVYIYVYIYYIYLGVCAPVGVHTHECGSTWRLEVDAGNHPWCVFSLIQWGSLPSKPRIHRHGWSHSPLSLWVLSFSPEDGNTGVIYVCSGNLNSNPASLSLSHFPWPCAFVFKHSSNHLQNSVGSGGIYRPFMVPALVEPFKPAQVHRY